MKKVLFVCMGNTCRSPMAQFILQSELEKAGITDVEVGSAGLCAVKDSKTAPNALKALEELGIKAVCQDAVQLDSDMLKAYDLIILIPLEFKSILPEPNVLSFDEITGLGAVPDPFGESEEEYIKTAKLLLQGMDKIIEKIKESEDG